MAKNNLPKNFIGIDALKKVAEQVDKHYFYGRYTIEELLDDNVSPEERAKRDAVIEQLIEWRESIEEGVESLSAAVDERDRIQEFLRSRKMSYQKE